MRTISRKEKRLLPMTLWLTLAFTSYYGLLSPTFQLQLFDSLSCTIVKSSQSSMYAFVFPF
jgi:hypothetical protein